MTLVGSKEGNVLPIMLSVQQQHHHHHGLRASSTASAQNHRGNVIVSTGSMPANEMKSMQQHGCKRSKIYGQPAGPYGTVPHQPASVARRNARERNRVKQVNNGFATLRQHIPQSVAQALGGGASNSGAHAAGSRAGSKKLSKVETLRMAVEYIRSLQRLLDENDGGSDLTGGPSPTASPHSSNSSASSTCSSAPGLGPDTNLHSPELRLRGGVVVGNDIRHHDGSELHRHQHLRQNPSPTFIPAPCSEASSSPTPSFVSDASSAGSQGYGGAPALYNTHTEAYDNYEPMSPEDEELLDVISWWQQSQ